MTTKPKEIVEVEKQVKATSDVVLAFKINTADDFNVGVELGGQIKKAQKLLTEKKEAITKPLNEALKNARDLFRPHETALENLERHLKGLMLAFKEKERKEAETQKAKLESKVESGYMKPETAVAKAQAIETTDKTVKTTTGAKATETYRIEYVVVDVNLIPREYLVPDMQAIKLAFKEGKPVAGVEARKVASMSF